MKNKDWGRGRGGLNREGEGGLINFPPLKRGGLFERGGLNRGFTVFNSAMKSVLNTHTKHNTVRFDCLFAL